MCNQPSAGGHPSAQDDWTKKVLGVDPAAKAGSPQSNGAAGSNKNPLEVLAVQVEIDKLALEPLRGLANAEASDAFNNYCRAIEKARGELGKLEAQTAKDEQLKFEIMIAIGLVIATPLTAGAAAAIAGAALTEPMTRTLAREMPEILQRARIPAQTGINITVAVNESITRLAGKFSASDSQKILGEVTKSLAKAMPIAAQRDRFSCGKNYLDAMESIVEASKKELNKSIANATFDQLLSVYNAFKNNSKEHYYANVSKLLTNFMDQMADVMVNRAKAMAGEQTSKDTIVKMDAYGRIRYARVLMHIASNPIFFAETNYTFKAWVAPELEEMAEKMGAQKIDPKMIVGHLPAPPPDPPPPPIPTVNVKDLPDAPVNVKDLPDAPKKK